MADYNINAITRRVVFTGSAGLGPYAFTFEVLDENDVAVYFNTTLLTLTTDYTVTINANGTGSVTIVTGSSVPSTPTASDSIIIVGARDIERVTDFVTAGDLLASSLNEQLDALTIFDQQLAEENARTLRAPVYDPALVADGGTLDMTLPAKAARAGKYLQFNSTTGNPEAGPDSTDVTALADIATDIATLADIEDGTDATDAIQTVAGISANVTTVAGIASNVSTVAGIQADVTAVAGDATDIGTVATNIASVNTVAGNISEVVAVANDLNEAVSEVETVANDLNEAVSEIETVAASIANVDTVGTNIANVNTVAGNNANVTTVAGISANVTTVAGISGNVTTVAGISGDVTTVAADGTDIGTVAGAISNVNTVAGISGNVTTVAGISGNVTTVAGISSDVTAVAADATDIGTVATNLTGTDTIGTVATNIANVNSVGGSISNVNTVATNISSVNDFADKYRIGASDPTVDNDEGDLFYNTTTDTLKVYTGAAWEQGVTAGSGFLSTTGGTMTGDITLSSADITGTGNVDITGTLTADGLTVNGTAQIERSGSSPLLQFTDTGVNSRWIGLVDGTSNFTIYGTNGVTQELTLDASGNVGIGTASVDNKLHLENAGTLYLQIENTSTANKFYLGNSGGNAILESTGAYSMNFKTNGSERMRIDSAGKVGIGTSGPVTGCQLTVASGGLAVTGQNTAHGANSIRIGQEGSGVAQIRCYGPDASTNGQLSFNVSESDGGGVGEAMRIDSSGNVGIGTASPSAPLHTIGVNGLPATSGTTQNNALRIGAPSTNVVLDASSNGGVGTWLQSTNQTDLSLTYPLLLNPNGGNVGIGTAAPSRAIHVVSSGLNIATFEASNGNSIDLGYDSLSASRTGDFFIDNRDASGNNIQYRCGSSASHIFNIGTSEKARLDASGNLLVGNTSNTTSQAGVYLNSNGRFFATHSGSSSIFNRLSTDGDILLFQKDTSTVGSISVTGSGTTYNTTSDLRLKENIEPLVATDKLMAMNPVSYNWKADPDGPRSMGFIAQEMQEVMPEAVSTGDDEDAMMSMDYGRITPILVSALQDAHRKIEQLEQRIADMEAK